MSHQHGTPGAYEVVKDGRQATGCERSWYVRYVDRIATFAESKYLSHTALTAGRVGLEPTTHGPVEVSPHYDTKVTFAKTLLPLLYQLSYRPTLYKISKN